MPDATEIERKFLLHGLPPQLGFAHRERMRQGYVALDGDTEVRVRISNRASTLTIKRGRGAVRVEEELALDDRQAESLWKLSEGRQLEKTRRRMRVQGVEVEVDEYAGHLDGLVVAEIEFNDEDAAMDFTPPTWFGRDLTGEVAYSNRALASEGLPRSG